MLSRKIGNPLKPYECQELNGDQSFAYMRDKRLHSNTEECVGTQKHSDPQKKVAVILDKCSPNDQSQKWDFEQSVIYSYFYFFCFSLFNLNGKYILF